MIENMKTGTVRTGNFEMDYFSFGSGSKNFVILPGISLKSIMLSAPAVAAAYADFGKDFTVWTFDRKRDIRKGYSVEDMSEDTFEAMKALGITDACLFGASQGGSMAMCLAYYHPELVCCAVLGSTAANAGEGRELLAKWASSARAGDKVSLNRSFFSAVYSDEYLKKYADAFAFLENEGTPEELERLAILCEAMIGFDFTGKLSGITVPMLAIGSAKDKVFGAKPTLEIAERSGCDYYVYREYGHAVYDEALDYKKRIADFFDKCGK